MVDKAADEVLGLLVDSESEVDAEADVESEVESTLSRDKHSQWPLEHRCEILIVAEVVLKLGHRFAAEQYNQIKLLRTISS